MLKRICGLMLCIASLLIACSNGTVQVPSPLGVTPTMLDATQEAMPTPYAPPAQRITLRPFTPLPTSTNTPAAIVILTFFNALNTGRFDDATALLDDDIGISDCNFQAIKNISFAGKLEASKWLRERIADHDHFFVNDLEGPGTSPTVFGVGFDRRTSDTLRLLGFPNGIRNQVGAKVILTSDLKRLVRLALGPGPLSDGSTCRPEPYR
jgi:hypothetical protein